MARLTKFLKNNGILGCFYCGVDSKPLLLFLICLVGCLGIGTIMIAVGLYLKGRFKDTESVKYEIFEVEERI